MLPKGYKTVIDWFQEVARVGNGYKNEVAERIVEDDEEDGEVVDWDAVDKKGFEYDEDYEDHVKMDEKKGGVVVKEIVDDEGPDLP